MYTGWPKGWAVFRLAKEVWKDDSQALTEKNKCDKEYDRL